MEDYKKKYEEALDNFKKIKAANKYNNELVDFIEYKYPELKENEDEKIRKECISIIDAWDKSCRLQGDYCEVAPKCIAWLEKQGEQKQNVTNIISDLENYFATTTKEQQQKDWDEIKNWEEKHFNHDKHIEQKHTWSEEDENMLNFYEKDYNNLLGNWKTKDVIEHRMQFRKWLKSLKERYTWKPSDEQMTYLSQVMDRNDYCGSVLYSLYQELKRL